MKKTLIVTLEYPPQIGGIASYVYNLAAHLPKESVVVCAPKIKDDKEFDAKNQWLTVRVKPLFSFLWPRWLKLFFIVRRIVRREQIEQVFIHHTLPIGYVGLLSKKFFKIPYTIFLHGTDLRLGTKNRWKRKMFQAVCLGAQSIVVNSEFMRHELMNKLEGLKNALILHPCASDIFLQPVSIERVNQLRAELALGGKKVILSVGRFIDGKGFPHLLNLWKDVLATIPNAVLVLIGDGSKRVALIQQIQKNNLQNTVRLLGAVPYQNLPVYYQLADLFVLLTHADENKAESWGTVFLEAAASGIPVVAGRVGGVEEAVENLITGLVVDVYNRKATTTAIIELLRNNNYAKQMGQAGRERVSKELNWSEQIKQIIN